MSQIHTYATVQCRFEDAPERLYAHLKDGVGTLSLGIALGDLHIETNVEVRVREKSTFTGYHMMDIGWKPSTSGPYPEFNGTLTISQDTIEWSRLELDGDYRPPFGLAGSVFDATLGHRIAEATGNQLLAKLSAMLTEPLVLD